MQLKKLSPLAGLILTGLLGACGGGGDEPPAPAAPPPPAAVVASSATISSTPLSIENKSLQFAGGACSGGTPPFATATWNFGDSTPTSTSNTHTYASAGTYSVTVTCTDSKNVTATSSPTSVVVNSAAYEGFLGRTWSAYASIDPANKFTYPVAGIASGTGDIYSVWLRSNADTFGTYMTTTDVAAGSSTFSATSWTMSADIQAGTQGTPKNMAPFDGTNFNPKAAAMDMAVSKNGKAMAAWMTDTDAGTALWYATKDATGSWSIPVKVTAVPATGVGSVLDASIKVVVNDAGDGAIAYCNEGTTPSDVQSSVVIYSSAGQSITGTPGAISNQCDQEVSYGNAQRSRAFDIAIKNTSEVVAVGLATSATNTIVRTNTYTLTGTVVPSSPFDIATFPTADLPSNFSLSYSLSPNSSVAAVAWTEKESPPSPYAATKLVNVKARISVGTTWGAALPTQTLTIHNFARPLIAVNDFEGAFLAVERPTTPGNTASFRTFVSNYASTTGWSTSLMTDSDTNTSADYRLNAADIAIDKWGTGLLTRTLISFYTQAGTFSKEGVWSGFTTISPAFTNFHYQTMRASPDGQAVLVTSAKGTGSGYLLLK